MRDRRAGQERHEEQVNGPGKAEVADTAGECLDLHTEKAIGKMIEGRRHQHRSGAAVETLGITWPHWRQDTPSRSAFHILRPAYWRGTSPSP
jgi:hypothetical protein